MDKIQKEFFVNKKRKTREILKKNFSCFSFLNRYFIQKHSTKKNNLLWKKQTNKFCIVNKKKFVENKFKLNTKEFFESKKGWALFYPNFPEVEANKKAAYVNT